MARTHDLRITSQMFKQFGYAASVFDMSLLVDTCSLYIENNAWAVPVGPPWSSFSYVNWELSWRDNHLSVTMLGGIILPGQTSTDGL